MSGVLDSVSYSLPPAAVSQKTGGPRDGQGDWKPTFHQLASTEPLRCLWLVGLVVANTPPLPVTARQVELEILDFSRSQICSSVFRVTFFSPISIAPKQKAQHPRRALRLSNNGNYSLDLPAFLAFAHIAFIASDLACLKAREILLLRFTGSAAGAVSD